MTAYEHSWEIRDAYGYCGFHDEQVLVRFGESVEAIDFAAYGAHRSPNGKWAGLLSKRW